MENLGNEKIEIKEYPVISREFVKENYVHKDKIRELVAEIKNRKVEDDFITASTGKLNTIIELEKLLEEE